MGGSARIGDAHKKAMLKFMKEHPELAFGRIRTSNANTKAKLSWNDWRTGTVGKRARMIAHAKGTGGGEPLDTTLTPLEEELLDFLGPDATGMPEVAEGGFQIPMHLKSRASKRKPSIASQQMIFGDNTTFSSTVAPSDSSDRAVRLMAPATATTLAKLQQIGGMINPESRHVISTSQRRQLIVNKYSQQRPVAVPLKQRTFNDINTPRSSFNHLAHPFLPAATVTSHEDHLAPFEDSHRARSRSRNVPQRASHSTRDLIHPTNVPIYAHYAEKTSIRNGRFQSPSLGQQDNHYSIHGQSSKISTLPPASNGAGTGRNSQSSQLGKSQQCEFDMSESNDCLRRPTSPEDFYLIESLNDQDEGFPPFNCDEEVHEEAQKEDIDSIMAMDSVTSGNDLKEKNDVEMEPLIKKRRLNQPTEKLTERLHGEMKSMETMPSESNATEKANSDTETFVEDQITQEPILKPMGQEPDNEPEEFEAKRLFEEAKMDLKLEMFDFQKEKMEVEGRRHDELMQILRQLNRNINKLLELQQQSLA